MTVKIVARATASAASLAAASAFVSTINSFRMPALLPPGSPIDEHIVVCIPARDEADKLPALVVDLTRQRWCSNLRIVVLDDDSTDGTAAAARAAAAGDRRIRVVESRESPPFGWTGKAAACAQLVRLAEQQAEPASVIVFLDADVRLEPEALASAVELLRASDVSLLCPWPEQLSERFYERLLQPLLAWSWMSSLPVQIGNATLRPSMAVACGQFMVFDADAYRTVGGHGCVAASVTEDLDLARALRRDGFRTAVASSGGFARCRMYGSTVDLRAGYSRWLWNEFGGPIGSAAAAAALAAVYVLPPVVALTASGSVRRLGRVGYLAGFMSRVAARRRETGARLRPIDVVDAMAHPLSVLAFVELVAQSHVRRRRGALTWKSRPMPPTAH